MTPSPENMRIANRIVQQNVIRGEQQNIYVLVEWDLIADSIAVALSAKDKDIETQKTENRRLELKCRAMAAKDDAAKAEKPTIDIRHKYQPHKKYPQFCGRCGYAEHEVLQHFQEAEINKMLRDALTDVIGKQK